MRWSLLLLVACGSTAPIPASGPGLARSPTAAPAPTPKPLPPIARVTCADAGVLLRGTVEDSRKAGPAKEAAIASACLFDKWSQEILDCVGGELDPKSCLAKLSTEQRAALDAKLTGWTQIYEGESWETAEDEQLASMPPEISCSTIITMNNVATFTPALTLVGEERYFAVTMRRTATIAACTSWPRPIRACVRDGTPIDTCRARLDGTQQTALAGKLAAIDAVMQKIAAAKKKPAATYDCKAVAAAHYGDAAWRGKAELAKNPKATRAELAKQAADRKQMIADARKLMENTCGIEGWNATQRACELVDGGELCAFGINRVVARWTYPPAGMLAQTGIPECDDYGLALQSLMACNKIPQQSKDAMKQAWDAMRAGWGTGLTADALRATTDACKQAVLAVRQSSAALGCSP